MSQTPDVKQASDWDRTTRGDVTSAYRLLLGRAPENDDVVARHLAAAQDIATFRRRMMSGPELYRVNRREIAASVVGKAPMSSTQGIDTDIGDEALQALFQHIRQVWSQLGDVEPHYSVLSDPKFKPGSMSSYEAEFYRTGTREIEIVLQRLSRLGLTPNPGGRAVELGCGVGRATVGLAAYFRNVTGYDVSMAHLALAKAYIDTAGLDDRVTLTQISDMNEVSIPACDFFYSRIVLQHNPPPVAKSLLRQFLARVRPGGIAVFQLITSLEGYAFDAAAYVKKMHTLDDQELHVLPQVEVFAVLAQCGFIPAEVYRDTSVSGLDRVSTTFIVVRT